jgi:SAM-dependent methyltransferase
LCTSIDYLIPIPGDCDYLVASGSRAIVGKNVPEGWPFELAVFVGRDPAKLRLRASLDDASTLGIAAIGEQSAFDAVDLSLFVRACIRRWPEDSCSLSWPNNLQLAGGDPLKARIRTTGDRTWLGASYADLRPAAQSSVSEVYRYPLDVPWLYDPLDYEVMIPILNRPGTHRILDLGCGSGRNAVPLENAGYEVHGIDSAPESIGICRAFVQRPERFREASVASLPYPADNFDAALDVGCLHMIPDSTSRETALAEIARVLKPGGLVSGRALTPRSPDWLSAQPFRSDAAGFTAGEIIEEADEFFEPCIIGRTQHLTYYKLLKIV